MKTMRIVVQRCRQARVTVGGEMIGSIGRGLMLLVGVTHEDTERDAAYLAEKAAGLRILKTKPAK
ncbi:hypothetical protein HMSSN036_95080 [Paenibacillus macerans]|nr:hypothetical protein HMSSN036_95080 [Paenibacillus macerans]